MQAQYYALYITANLEFNRNGIEREHDHEINKPTLATNIINTLQYYWMPSAEDDYHYTIIIIITTILLQC